MIVPPNYEVQLFGQGYCAAQISARKVTLVKFGEANGPSRFYNKFQAFVNLRMPDESYTIRDNVSYALFNLIPLAERGTD